MFYHFSIYFLYLFIYNIFCYTFNNIFFMCHSQSAEGNNECTCILLPLKKRKLKDRRTVGDRQQIGIPQEEKCWLMCQFTAVFVEERSEIERERENRMTHNLVWFLMTVLKTKRTVKFITWLVSFPASAITSQKRFYNSTSHIKMTLKGWIFTFCASFNCKYCIP